MVFAAIRRQGAQVSWSDSTAIGCETWRQNVVKLCPMSRPGTVREWLLIPSRAQCCAVESYDKWAGLVELPTAVGSQCHQAL